jgi:ABC-2 type transport system ATP-binding protein
MNLFVANNITKRFANHTALDKVSITVPENHIFGLLGPNGAGKTTLIRIINQITGPDEGELFLNGERMNTSHTALIGYLPEERGLYKKMKVGEQALYLAQLKGLKKADALKKLKYWFEKYEMQSWWNKKIEELSKGMQQKIQFIITILHEPNLLIFDEPFSGFDPINATLLRDEILNLRKNGATIIFSTHNMSSVEELCDDIALINKAKKILEGNVNDIRKKHKSNTYEIEFCSTNKDINLVTDGRFSITNIKKENDIVNARLKASQNNTGNEILQTMLALGEIRSFKEIIPSMNDVFISMVQQDENKQAV